MEKEYLRKLIDSGVLQENPDVQLVKDELDKLSEQGFVKELSDQFFEFENNLTWEVVYETLLYAERRRLHNLVACHIEMQNKGQLEAVSDVLAYHYEKSGNIKKSIWNLAIAGDRAASMYASDSAISSFSRALDLLDQTGRPYASDAGLLKEKIADVYKTAGRYKKATDYYQQVLELEKDIKPNRKSKYLPWKVRFSTRKSELCRKIAITIEARSDFPKAIEWLDEAISNLPKRPGGLGSRISAIRCGVLYRMGEYKDGIQWGKKALKHASRLKLEADVATAQNILGLIYQAEGKIEIAEEYFSKAVELFERLNDYPSIANTKNNLAICYMWTGELSRAIDSYFMALEADKRVQNISNMAMDHTNLAEALIMAGEIEKAEDHIKVVQETFENKLCPPDLAGLALVHLCRCEIINGNLSDSQKAIGEGIELIRNAGQKMILGQAELQLAELQYAQGEYSQAEKTCLDALMVIEELGMKPLEVIGKRILAEVKNELGFEDEAIEYIHDSIELAKEIGAKYDEAISVVVMVKIMREMLHAPLRLEAQNQCLRRATIMLTKMGAKRELEKAKRLRIH
jgi:tetratricopeptide (TPR) repeat protein